MIVPTMLPALALSLALLAPAPAAPLSAEGGVTRVFVEGPLDLGMQSMLRRALAEARERDDLLVLEIDTPGGEIELMWSIARMIDDGGKDGVHTVAWVNTHALSAGALITLACRTVYMRPVATIGSSAPVRMTPGGVVSVAEDVAQDETAREKFLSSMRGDFWAWAEEHGRPGRLAEAMVDDRIEVHKVRLDGEVVFLTGREYDDATAQGRAIEHLRTVSESGELLNLTGKEALDLGLIDGTANDFDELLEKIGRRGVTPVVVHRTRSEDLVSWVDQWAFLLILAGLVFGYLELKAPGFGVPGIASILCFTVFLVGRYLAGLADVPQILLVAGGVALVATEIFLVPGTIYVGLAGVVMVFVGLVWSNVGSAFGLGTPLGRELFLTSAFRTLLAAFAALTVMYLLSLVLPRTPVLNRLVVGPTEQGTQTASALPEAALGVGRVGSVGRALTDLRPVGKVVLDEAPERELEARSSGLSIDRGARVRVVEVAAGRLVVDPDENGEDGADEVREG